MGLLTFIGCFQQVLPKELPRYCLTKVVWKKKHGRKLEVKKTCTLLDPCPTNKKTASKNHGAQKTSDSLCLWDSNLKIKWKKQKKNGILPQSLKEKTSSLHKFGKVSFRFIALLYLLTMLPGRKKMSQTCALISFLPLTIHVTLGNPRPVHKKTPVLAPWQRWLAVQRFWSGLNRMPSY